MFHRVKSETQSSETKPQRETEEKYTRPRDEEREAVAREDSVPAKKEEQSERKFGYKPSRVQEEKEEVTSNNSDNNQAAYSRKEEEREEEGARGKSYQPSIARSSYGSTYAAPSYTPPQAPEPSLYAGNDRTLTIGRGINMSGEIDACDHLVVEGTVEAALKGAKALDIADTGTFYGTVEIEEAVIAGRFEGDLTVNGRLTLKASAVITGSIAYRELAVEAGAMIDGRMTPLKGEVDQKSLDKYRAGTEASAMAKAKNGQDGDRDAANADGSLFAKTRANY